MDGEAAPVWELRCDCGYVAGGETEDALVRKAQAHAREVHRMELSAERLRLMTRPPPAAPGQARASPAEQRSS